MKKQERLRSLGKVGIWQASLDALPASELIDVVQQIEAMGWKCVWSPEAVGRDVITTSTMILQSSRDLHAATGIAQIHARHPMTTAAAQKALNEGYQNRFVLGLGVSHEMFIVGMRQMNYDKPFTQMKNYLQAMKAATYMSVEPTEEPPLILAALGPKMLELSATEADGAHPYNTLPVHTQEARKIMGKDAWLAPEQKVIFETDPEKARQVARDSIGFYMELPNYLNNFKRMGFSDEDLEARSDKFIDGLFAWGDMDAIKARINEHLEAGADHVAIQAITPAEKTGPPIEEWKTLADEYF